MSDEIKNAPGAALAAPEGGNAADRVAAAAAAVGVLKKAALPKAGTTVKELTLSNGAVARVRPVRGRDLVKAAPERVQAAHPR